MTQRAKDETKASPEGRNERASSPMLAPGIAPYVQPGSALIKGGQHSVV
jgi:hypothetical protein